ncbi:ABC transporter substrate-binding protein [Tistrella mobilis]|uniref:Fe3+-hydroxamate ABC superfamily ATP binding cassette transporter periplasmic family protein n=1 Tax=Tistrella mobilis (strain KA081020-065) TaxID=1110502 RepID=I3TMZ0_TISMK|nr:ABC transporter substrate-binding protein [Tistrella mobilis]AFK54128.1 Fe3+-hydroxamate ABC superfamily ATP binding cassette transporter periplasmic family protein [Tistrella mobilis KA081020-065]
MARVFGLLLILFTCIAALPAAAEEGWPRQVTDALGRAVTIPAPPRRIVAIFSSNVEMLAAIGAGPDIVAIEAWTRWPPDLVARTARIGGRLGFSVEAIARLDADLVVMTPARQAAAGLVDPLGRIGIPALVLTHDRLDDILANIRLLGHATGREAAAAAVADAMGARIAHLGACLKGRPPVPVYMETGSDERGAAFTIRDATYTGDILRAAGGVSVFAGRDRLGRVSGEAVGRADPDRILIAGPPERVPALMQRPGWDGIRAVRAGRVDAVTRALLLIPGPRVVEGAEMLARLLHPDAFAAGGACLMPAEGDK